MTDVGSVRPGVPEPDEDFVDLMLDLAVPHEDVAWMLRLRRRLRTDAALRSLADEAVAAVASGVGAGLPRESSAPPPLPAEHDWPDDVVRGFPVYVYLAVTPVVRAYHRQRGVPDSVQRRTLGDLGRQLAVHRRRHGTGGLAAPGWLMLHFRGELYQIGRLQFERARLGGRSSAAVRAAGLPAAEGQRCLSLHIPDFRGPLAPDAVDRSLAAAAGFFARHFPEDGARIATCHSWLLDPQLAAYLPPTANIIRFQDRFRPARPGEPPEAGGQGDRDAIGFVFGDPALPPGDLPRRTTLERAIADHLRAGRHWTTGHGWLEL
ncbi:acyltransferase domain-containing protein [Streptomyces fuscigenes]|uniref:acyltransferase domain-containing protein n=1 Tax=Streptomyces fuscigenes TaxID=1528880 RepID=UPI001F26CFAB|nr:acyltransferase domain-containing protein [Streptomyces fuscigenes]MCF3963309.1 acyltransferase domain-containing protein [Streptomyces fuscigenes]